MTPPGYRLIQNLSTNSRSPHPRSISLSKRKPEEIEKIEAKIQAQTATLEPEKDRFSTAFHLSPDPMAIATFAEGRYLEVSESFCQTYGYDRSSLMALPESQLNIWYDPQDWESLKQQLQQQKTVCDREVIHRTRSGELKPVLLSAQLLKIEGIPCVLSVSKAMAQRQPLEVEVWENENRYNTLFEDSALQLWEQDFSKVKKYFNCLSALGVKDFRSFFKHNPNAVFQCLKRIQILRVNQATYTAFGAKTETEFLADLRLPTLFARDFRAFRELTIALAEGQQQFTSEFYYQRSDGSDGWAFLHFNVARGYEETLGKAIVSVIDISERKWVESALRESESKYRALVEACQDAIWSVDAQGCYTFVNSAVKRIYGYDPEETIGRSFADFAPPHRREQIRVEFDRLLAQKSFFQYEVVHLRQDGRPIHLLFNGIVRRSAEGLILGATGTASDITDRKRTELELQRAKEAADAANRAKSEFLANMSHELRTPLNAILGFTQVMSHDRSLSEEHKEHLCIINRSGEHLLELINNILEMSKIEAGRVTLNETQFDLYRLLDNLEDMFQLKAKTKGLQLVFEKSPALPRFIQTDERKLRQVLMNFLGNALKFTQEGSVTLRVLPLHRQLPLTREKGIGDGLQRIEERRLKENIPHLPLSLKFEVEDTGPGIAPEEVEALFMPFGQTEIGRQSQEGTGLGLSISRKFVHLMGGEITIDSKPGCGSIFQFEIDVKLVESVKASLTSAKAMALAPGQPDYRILVVDDRPESRLLAIALMESLGFQVRAAENGQEAIAVWECWQPHLILMDMQMPVMDGYEATRKIRALEQRNSLEWSGDSFKDKETTRQKGNICCRASSSAVLESPPLPVTIIALTASAFEQDRSDVLSVGCDDFMSKPFQEEVLFDRIAHYLGVRYLYEEPSPLNPKTSLEEGKRLSPKQVQKHLSQMPNEWISQVYQAAIKGSDRIIFQLVDCIPEAHSPLADLLKEWVHDFRFDLAMNLLKPFVE